MKVCVLKAGVVGVTCAYVLAQAGHAVTLVDARQAPAERTSFANGGQLSYSYVAPLASPDVWPNLPAWLTRRDAPLRFIPRLTGNSGAGAWPSPWQATQTVHVPRLRRC